MKSVRRNEIMRLLLMERSLKTEELARRLNVSVETIRRDINALEAERVVKKVYGGIELIPDSRRVTEMGEWEARLANCHTEKVKIAAKALEYIPDGSTVALDIGTTTYELSALLTTKKDLTVITNSLRVAINMAQHTNHCVYCIGGMMARTEVVAGGLAAQDFLNNFASIDFYMCSSDGITPESGMTEVDELVVGVKRRLIQMSDKVICMADHSKFGRHALFSTGSFEDIDTLITDDGVDDWYIKQIRAKGVDVVIAK